MKALNSTKGQEPGAVGQQNLHKVQACNTGLSLPRQFPKAKPIKVPCYLGCRVDWLGISFGQLVQYSLKAERRKARIADENKAGVVLRAKALASALRLQIRRLLDGFLHETSFQLGEMRRWHLKRLEPKLEVLESHLGIEPQVVPVTAQSILSSSSPIVDSK